MPKAIQSCRACGCTQNNCQHCIERTGHPCYWQERDLCSACAPLTNKSQHLSVHVWASRFRSNMTNEDMVALLALDGTGDTQGYVIGQWLRLSRQFGTPPITSDDGRYVLGSGTCFTHQDSLVVQVLGDLLAESAFYRKGGEA